MTQERWIDSLRVPVGEAGVRGATAPVAVSPEYRGSYRDEGGGRSITARWLLILALTLLVPGLARAQTGAAPDPGRETKLLPSDGAAGDTFGLPLSLSGDTALVGARFDDDKGDDSGSAYVFVRSGGVWTEQAKLLASDGAAYDEFGIVSLSGDTALVGARLDDDNGPGSGSAYVFVRSGGVWTGQTKLLASDGAVADWFGYAVWVSGDTALVGARRDDENGTDSGSVYVFERSGGVWTEQTKLLARDGEAGDEFGTSVVLSGDTALVGAHFDDDNGVQSGSAYVFVRSGGIWTEQAKLLASDGAAEDYFGGGISLSGDTAVVGAEFHDGNGTNSGSAWVFVRSDGAWTEQAKLLASDGVAEDFFGESVSLSGDIALVSAVGDDDNGTDSGSVYVFERSGGVWTEQTKLLASDGAAEDWLGYSVSLSGDTALVGADWDDDNGDKSGSAYVFVVEQTIFADGFESSDTSAWSSTVP